MKRIFPIIVLLITLSLLGIIMLQYSWFKQMIELRQAALETKVEEVVFDISMELSMKASSAPTLKVPLNPKLKLLTDDFTFGIGRPTIAQNYSYFEINEKIQKAFEGKGLKKVEYEFAITSNSNLYNIEMQSKDFLKESEDTINNKRKIGVINPESGSEMEGLVPFEHLIVVVPDFKVQVWGTLRWMILGAIAFTVIILTAFTLTIRTLLRQKKLSEIKTDFINNMTHEFKTPLATISLAVDALRNEKVQQNPEKRDYFNTIIKEENKRMNKHVETILQAALMEKQELRLNMKPVHAHELIQNALNNHQLQIEEKQSKVDLLLNAKFDMIEADEIHFTNAISNLIDNAIKYSKETLLLQVTTHCTTKSLVIKIEDNGIGMNKETVKRVFEKFYRAHTGNIHNIKGFGLGMNYVKTVIDVHRGKIKAESTLGKGSCFTIELPRIKT
ncbi:MAG TPA: HAMP domain-containing sensor histidine kinase [Segetibacter sp.]|jgi:two-component system phosphate regulon sensor histidine kinase PhoR